MLMTYRFILFYQGIMPRNHQAGMQGILKEHFRAPYHFSVWQCFLWYLLQLTCGFSHSNKRCKQPGSQNPAGFNNFLFSFGLLEDSRDSEGFDFESVHFKQSARKHQKFYLHLWYLENKADFSEKNMQTRHWTPKQNHMPNLECFQQSSLLT